MYDGSVRTQILRRDALQTRSHGSAGVMTSIPRSRHPKPASTSSVRTISTTYIREFGDWKAGAFVVPAFGTTSLRNEYSVQGLSGIKRQDNLNTNNGFRLGFKAGVWYQDIGVSVLHYRLVFTVQFVF